MNTTKKDRLIIIQEILSGHKIGSQEELLSMLSQKGFNITQATLSRDIKSLKIIKSPDVSGNYIYTLPERNYAPYASTRKEVHDLNAIGYVSIEFSGNLGVMKTRPGYAMGIASDIDLRASHVILGTIAGDDTILLIPREGISRETIIEILSTFIPNIHV